MMYCVRTLHTHTYAHAHTYGHELKWLRGCAMYVYNVDLEQFDLR